MRYKQVCRLQTALSNAGIRPGTTVSTSKIGSALASAWGLVHPPVVQCSNGYISQVGQVLPVSSPAAAAAAACDQQLWLKTEVPISSLSASFPPSAWEFNGLQLLWRMRARACVRACVRAASLLVLGM